jgi:hypothetical protein
MKFLKSLGNQMAISIASNRATFFSNLDLNQPTNARGLAEIIEDPGGRRRRG